MRPLSFLLLAVAAGLCAAPRALALPLPADAKNGAAPAPQFGATLLNANAPREYSRAPKAMMTVAGRRLSVAPQANAALLHSEAQWRSPRSLMRTSSNIARATLPQIAMLPQIKAAAPRLAALQTSSKNAFTVTPKEMAPREYSRAVVISESPKNSASKPDSVVEKSASRPAPVAALPAAPTRAMPTPLASRQMVRDRILLAQLEKQLRSTQNNLDRADADLSASQRQLAAFSGTLQKAMMEAGVDARGLNPFVRVAQKYAGTPYVWGGESRNGFDCSGFIIVVMRELGYKTLPHSAAEQFNYGQPIAQALLKPGDLVFFANTYKPGISHVGIYLGKRRFIHAAGTGIGTIVSSLDTAKFQAKYAGARRLVASR